MKMIKTSTTIASQYAPYTIYADIQYWQSNQSFKR